MDKFDRTPRNMDKLHLVKTQRNMDKLHSDRTPVTWISYILIELQET